MHMHMFVFMHACLKNNVKYEIVSKKKENTHMSNLYISMCICARLYLKILIYAALGQKKVLKNKNRLGLEKMRNPIPSFGFLLRNVKRWWLDYRRSIFPSVFFFIFFFFLFYLLNQNFDFFIFNVSLVCHSTKV